MIHFGRDNIARNNIFAFGRSAQLSLLKPERHNTLTFEHNIVYWSNANLLFHGAWHAANVQFDNNIYWNAMSSTQWLSDAVSYESWQRLGRDTHSKISNPGFTNLARDVFAIDSSSPAFAVGFQDFSRELPTQGR